MPTPLLSLPLLLALGHFDDALEAPPAEPGGEPSTTPVEQFPDAEAPEVEEAQGEPAEAGDTAPEGADDEGEGADEVDPSVSGGTAEAEGPDAGELDLDDIFGTADDHEIPTLGATATEGGGGGGLVTTPRPPSKWDALDARMRVVSSIYMDVDDSYNGKRFSPDFRGRGNFSRHETRIEIYAAYTPNEHISIVADIEPVFLRYPEPPDLEGLTDRFQLAPFHVESDAAYVHLMDVLPGLDFKFGRQIVVWGTADKFNPTNNINADDLEDRPLFTEPIANQMAVVEFNPWGDKLWVQGVWVPWFVPALLPTSAVRALTDSQAIPPYVRDQDLDAIEFLQGFIKANPRFDPRILTSVSVPNRKFTNSQSALKVGSSLGPVDLSASYYYGFHDIPMPVEVESEQLNDLNDDLEDLPPAQRYWFESTANIIYPRMHVWGLDFATQLGFLDNAGLWGEAALILPARQYELRTELPIPIDVTPGDGMANPIREINGPTVGGRNGRASPFLKATMGADYTIGKHVYVQAQYLRGMIDQFGAGNIGNFLVAGTDLVFFGRHLVFRTFTVTEFPELGKKDDVPSVAIAPDLIVVPPWGFLTFELGGFALVGRRDTYFGSPYTGSSIVYFKATGQF